MSNAKVGLAALVAATPANIETVVVGEIEVPMKPVTAAEFVAVLGKFPGLRAALTGVFQAGDDSEDVLTEGLIGAILADGPEGAASLIAKAAMSNVAASAILALPDDTFHALLEAAVKLTMPKGASDFFGRVARLASLFQPVAEAKVA